MGGGGQGVWPQRGGGAGPHKRNFHILLKISPQRPQVEVCGLVQSTVQSTMSSVMYTCMYDM